jgi:ABC-2 type transport system permease protein
MLNLIFKDIYFNLKQFFIGILAAMGFSLIILDGEKYSTAAMLMIPSLLFTSIIGRVCSAEDKRSVYSFLGALPIKKSYIVISKYIESYIIMIMAYIILAVMNFILGFFIDSQYDLTSSIVLIVFSIVIIYNSVYLFLNFKFGNAQAQQTVYVLVVLYVLIFVGYKYIKNELGASVILSDTILGWGCIILSVLISVMLCALGVKAYANRE